MNMTANCISPLSRQLPTKDFRCSILQSVLNFLSEAEVFRSWLRQPLIRMTAIEFSGNQTDKW